MLDWNIDTTALSHRQTPCQGHWSPTYTPKQSDQQRSCQHIVVLTIHDFLSYKIESIFAACTDTSTARAQCVVKPSMHETGHSSWYEYPYTYPVSDS